VPGATGEERRRKEESQPTEIVEGLPLCFARFGKTGSGRISCHFEERSRIVGEAEFVTLYR
jgi:hypothetical protein